MTLLEILNSHGVDMFRNTEYKYAAQDANGKIHLFTTDSLSWDSEQWVFEDFADENHFELYRKEVLASDYKRSIVSVEQIDRSQTGVIVGYINKIDQHVKSLEEKREIAQKQVNEIDEELNLIREKIVGLDNKKETPKKVLQTGDILVFEDERVAVYVGGNHPKVIFGLECSSLTNDMSLNFFDDDMKYHRNGDEPYQAIRIFRHDVEDNLQEIWSRNK